MKEGNSLAFVDTNILVYAFDRSEGKKHTLAAGLIGSLWQSRSGCISIQVLQEFYVAMTRPKGQGLSLQESQRIISSFAYWQIVSPKVNDILQAIEIQNKYKFPFWDSLIIQSALVCNCNKLYSEDLSHGQMIEGVKIVNPFLNERQNLNSNRNRSAK